jgi:UDP-2-acetamido-3-amino-2,3-dideoxy-glucuronate N-acetyltransferase
MKGVSLLALPTYRDSRPGALTALDFQTDLPFLPKRMFFLHGHQMDQCERGNHAHRSCRQFFVCVAGTCTVRVCDGSSSQSHLLASPAQGLSVAAMLWVTVTAHSSDCVVLVLASEAYDAEDYIHDFTQFCALATSRA